MKKFLFAAVLFLAVLAFVSFVRVSGLLFALAFAVFVFPLLYACYRFAK